ncbi:MAG: BrnT family toxin [Bdellovibrio sp.]|nr:BrnT family toxin [Bdellovibrio sp.]
MIAFEWDLKKNKANRKKHGVWFEEATQVFDDEKALMFFDKDHSETEENRFILLGQSTSHVLVVIYCERRKSTVRIISARKATTKEVKQYEKGI